MSPWIGVGVVALVAGTIMLLAYIDGRKAVAEQDALELNRESEVLLCEVLVLRDLLERARWYLGDDVQTQAPTIEQTLWFVEELREVLDAHKKEGGVPDRNV